MRKLVPAMLKSREGVADAILHIGVSVGRKTFDIECCANRRGYVDAQDMSGETTRDERCFEEYNDCEESLSTTLDVAEVLSLWLDELRIPSGSGQNVTLRRSSNAGGYLCEYILYNSLTWFSRRDRAGIRRSVQQASTLSACASLACRRPRSRTEGYNSPATGNRA